MSKLLSYFKSLVPKDNPGDQSQCSQQSDKGQYSGWRPFYLQRRILIIFLIAFCAAIAGLEFLNHVSQVNQGIASSTEDLHYIWTYCPTAILTIVAAFWSRVDFQAKQNRPWQSMHESPQVADKSVLLDYITEMPPIALKRAIHNKHFIVAAGVSCSLLLSLLITISTGLFLLQEVQVNVDNIPILLHDYFTSEDPKFNAGGETPRDIVQGVTLYNGSYPGGTNANFAFQQFSAPNISSGASVTAPIKVLAAELNCESAVMVDTQVNINGSIIISTSSCMNVKLDWPKVPIAGYSTYMGLFREGRCENSTGLDGMRIAVVAAAVSTPPSTEPYDVTGIIIENPTQLICKPTYAVVDMDATKNISESSSDIRFELTGSKNATLPGITAWDIAQSVYGAKNDLAESSASASPNPFDVDASYIDDALKMGSWAVGLSGSIRSLLLEDVLNNVASSYYRAMSAQYMNKGLVQKDSSMTTGSAIIMENRVFMTQLPLRLMEVCLVFVIFLVIAMIYWTPDPVTTSTPWNPNTIAATAAIMAQSKAFGQFLSGTSVSQLPVLQNLLRSQKFRLKQRQEGLSIDTLDDETSGFTLFHGPQSASPNSESVPFPGVLFRITTFVTVALIIVALEIVLQVSQANDGLGDITSGEHMHYAWTVFPSFIMVMIGLPFGSMSSNCRMLAPFALLKRPSGAAFKDCMTVNFLDALDVTVMLNSIRTKQFAVLATTLAAFITSLLSILTSGLFSAIEVPYYVNANFTPQDNFRYLSSQNTWQGPTLPPIADAIVQQNLSFPRWTYGNLVFPKLSLNASLAANLTEDSFVDLWVPALRATPICVLQTGSGVNHTFRKLNQTFHELHLNMPKIRCPPYRVNETWAGNGVTVQLPNNAYFGYGFQMSCTFDDPNNSMTDPVYPTAYYWGQVENGSLKNLAAMSCNSAAETINTLTRFQLPDFDISEDHAPAPNDSSATPLDIWVPDGTWSQYFFSTDGYLNAFFTALIKGRWAIPQENLGEASQTEKVAKAIKFQAGILNALQYNNASRNATLEDPLPGNVFLRSRLRLVEDATSARILEGLLGSMLILGVLGTVLMNTDHILPKRPSSIAARASLLAESNFLSWYQPLEKDPNKFSFPAGSQFFLGRQNADSASDSFKSYNTEKGDRDLTIYHRGPPVKDMDP
ncbi:uncharacterized protein N7496_002454 [Penicillium cataractarum]|uniref:Uncharacterized protein n=1 Tax=Penicillium cataractarum TaxID=2100454 RepID=A0A9W9SK29_9EURO|nr:uncharacterized protein N7496_002454 [Penicillium cataractarum]KAJ5380026.1 hypothetical protein N7496_002454 [Penicillium cataractarum]